MGKPRILLSFVILLAVFGTMFIDLAGGFGYTDVSFVIGFVFFGAFILLQRSTSKITFGMTLLLLLFLGTSYIPTGAGKVTERIGEWFYLFFVLGLIQYIRESWKG